ncbi:MULTISPECIES: alpha-mannosidase [unclassified Lentimonas]|uniref:glycoside hydrolase family 38 N-terminal domain-containing protein n=1 Tax=unclassified Lentimonas TaxID=2630993 RepID=UPI00132B66ED|nr:MULTISPECIES: alpha-mannosidase [unclassified Lentimonas]CAA6680172.1 Alpha-mannosidase (EC [Lentimonas sp. CC4]CAA6687400.1 Alpha-mannosidase (EC [Lentimonas sp. CC6]CAA7076054.1 Alpha-mannosidase (EC [Lentimonas sp. CC4]CAA7171987.1 Alpha-mannosidase (EC [Lentimonas sp. CC21]CAA7181105.1 Alpha-mannosidase (EC [Lentimonas sp. CC8]
MDPLTHPSHVFYRIHKQLVRLNNEFYSLAHRPKVHCHYQGEARISLDEARALPSEEWTGPRNWGQLWDQAWFRLEVPATSGGLFLHWPDQAEAIAWIDGKVAFGFDPAHRYFELPTTVSEIWIQARCVQSAIWHPDASGLDGHGSRFMPPALCQRDTLTWKLYHDLRVLHDRIRCRYTKQETPNSNFNKDSGVIPDYTNIEAVDRILLGRLATVADTIDSDDLETASAQLDAIYQTFEGADKHFQAIRTGHCHIDLVWLWPEHIGIEKAVHSFANVDYLMERYPELQFGYSQPASYDAVEAAAPELSERVAQRISEGRWEALGALWVESDTHIPCGEALSRAFAIGQDWFRSKLGAPSEILWLPDTFGLSGSLPSIAAQHGLRYFFGNKPTWNRFNTFQRTSFRWQGPDGNELITHIAPENIQSYNGYGDVRELTENAIRHQDAHVHPEVLLPTGFGDGGGGPTAEMCEYARRTENLHGLPANKWDRLSNFFDRLGARKDDLEAHKGELYLEAHRGVATTNRKLKLAYRQAETGLQLWEATRVLQGGAPVPTAPWKRVSFAQFHDCVTGAAVFEVTDAFVDEMSAISQDARSNAATELTGDSSNWLNPLPIEQRITITDTDGSLNTVTLPPLSVSDPAQLSCVTATATLADADTLSLSNNQLQAQFNRKGEISSLQINGSNIEMLEPLAQLQSAVDRNPQFPAWDIDEAPIRTMAGHADEAQTISATIDENGTASLTFERTIEALGSFTICYTLSPEAHDLHLRIDMDFKAERRLLKLQFPTNYQGRYARFGSAFGSTQRPQIKTSIIDYPQWEVPGSRWATVSDDSQHQGLSVITDACYGFSCDHGNLGVSLLHTVAYTGEETHLGPVTKSLRRNTERPHFIDLGKSSFELRIGHYHADLPRAQQPAAVAERLLQPAIPCSADVTHAGLLAIEGGDSLIPHWSVPNADGSWTLRLHETLGRSGSARLKLAEGWTIEKTNLAGETNEAVNAESVAFEAFEIMSLRLITHTR